LVILVAGSVVAAAGSGVAGPRTAVSATRTGVVSFSSRKTLRVTEVLGLRAPASSIVRGGGLRWGGRARGSGSGSGSWRLRFGDALHRDERGLGLERPSGDQECGRGDTDRQQKSEDGKENHSHDLHTATVATRG
jgi:hypothetical protein